MYRVDVREPPPESSLPRLITRRAELPAPERAAFIDDSVEATRAEVRRLGGTLTGASFSRARPARDGWLEVDAGVEVTHPLPTASPGRCVAWPTGAHAVVAIASLEEAPAAEAAARSFAAGSRRAVLGPGWLRWSGQPARAELWLPVSSPQPPLVLASTSSARRALLDALGVAYAAVSPGVTEEVPAGTSVADAVALLAERKARAVCARHPDALVIGADQLVSLDGVALGKPDDRAIARAQLSAMLGRTHEILTGVCLIRPGGAQRTVVDVARLTLAPLSPDALERYLDLGEWQGCAGSYRVEGQGQALFTRIDGDRTSVQGLPMPQVIALLREAGMEFFTPNPR